MIFRRFFFSTKETLDLAEILLHDKSRGNERRNKGLECDTSTDGIYVCECRAGQSYQKKKKSLFMETQKEINECLQLTFRTPKNKNLTL